MAGATHPFFGNQYTDGGYIIGSFKFPEGLTREVSKHLTKTMPTIVSPDTSVKSTARGATLIVDLAKTVAKYKWIIALIVSAIAATGSYFAYKYYKNKGIVKIPNVGVCEHCGEPLSEGNLIPDNDNPYIVCKNCGKKNYAHYHNDNNASTPDAE